MLVCVLQQIKTSTRAIKGKEMKIRYGFQQVGDVEVFYREAGVKRCASDTAVARLSDR
jgi:hypothetical protein